MGIPLSTRAALIRASKNAALQDLSRQCLAEGRPVIDASKGELNLPPPEVFLQHAAAAVLERHHKYTDTVGSRELREQVAAYVASRTGLTAAWPDVAMTAGAKQALYNVALAIIDPGDEVLIPAPFWTSFPEQVRLAGGVPVAIDTSLTSFELDVEAVAARVGPRTKAIIVNTPHNPTGCVYTDAQLTDLFDLAARRGLFVVLDICYADLSFPERKRAPLVALVKDPARTIVVDSFSKSWSLTGWRIGYVFASPDLVKVVNSFQSHTTSNPNCIAQIAVLRTLRDGLPASFTAAVIDHLRRNRDLAVARLSDLDGVTFPRPEGAFFIYVDVRGLLAAERTDIDRFCESLLKDRGVLVVPGTAFGDVNGFRFSFCGDPATVARALDEVAAHLSNKARLCREH